MAKFILGGSLEILSSGYIQCAVFEGDHKWDIKGNKTIKYVSFEPKGKGTVHDLAVKAYEELNGTK